MDITKEDLLRFVPMQVVLSKANETQTVQLLRVGTFHDSRYGTLNITPEVLLSMKKNFDDKVRGVDLMIDYKHDSDSLAAGWIKEVYLSDDNNQLWAKVEWTPNGQKTLSDKEFRYLSADFNLNYQDNETLKRFGPTLFGAGLTNRPVVKNMQPAVALQELTPEGRKHMQTEIEKLNAKFTEAEKKMTELSEANKKLSDQLAALPAAPAKPNPDAPAEGDDMKKKMEDLQSQLSAMSAKCADYEKQMGDMKAGQKLSEQKLKFQKLLSEGRAVPAQEKAFLDGDTIKFAELSQSINLHGSGHGGTAPVVGSVDEQIHQLAEKKMSENKSLDYRGAVSTVLKENPALANQRNK